VEADPKRTYPDLGASFETFTNADFLEQETLGPMTKLAPGASLDQSTLDIAQNVHIANGMMRNWTGCCWPLVGK